MSKPPRPPRRRRWWRIAFTVTALLGCGALAELWAEHSDREHFAPVGRILAIQGERTHVFARGTGKTTTVFVSGWRTPSAYVSFYPVFSELTSSTRVVVYDKPGIGFSDPSQRPRDIQTMTEQLWETLHKAGERPPYLLVGHSLASLVVLRFAQQYPSETKGLVLVDAVDPQGLSVESVGWWESAQMNATWALFRTGLPRFLFTNPSLYSFFTGSGQIRSAPLPPELQDLNRALLLSTLYNSNQRQERQLAPENAQKLLTGPRLGTLPLVVLSAERSNLEDPEWQRGQERLKRWSKNAKHRVVPGSPHAIQSYAPESVVDAILQLL